MDRLRDCGDDLPVILFLDINMPEKNGLECLAEIRADNGPLKDLRVVMLSTSANPKHISEAWNNGAAFYAIKPIDFTSLTKVIRKVLSHDWESAVPQDNFVIDYNPPGVRQLHWHL